MVDLHAHILPGIDDGPRSLDDALAFARAAVAAGTRVLAATPHVNDRFDPAPGEVVAAVGELEEALAGAGIPLALATGAEVAHARLGDLDADRLAAHSLGGRGVILLECEPPAARDVEEDVTALLNRGHGVLLAHAERCRVFRDDPGLVARLAEAGAFVSVTAASFAGAFGASAERLAFVLLEAGLVDDIASDAHDANHRRPDLCAGHRAIGRRLHGAGEWARWLVDESPAALLAGEQPPAAPGPPPTPRRGLGRFLPR